MEVWKDIIGYEGLYQVSNFGRVKSLQRKASGRKNIVNERMLKPQFNGEYYHFGISKNGIQKIVLIHRIVASHFIPNPENKPEVNHLNGDKSCNEDWNLAWATEKENCKHAREVLNKKPGTGIWNQRKLTEAMVVDILAMYNTGSSQVEIAKNYNITKRNINDVIKRRIWKQVNIE